MTDNSRLQDLQRRVQKDPASIAFAQLAEEYRRAARFDDAVDVCRAGLAIHPAYLSARVTLGRALIELDQPDDAQRELEQVRVSAPENLAAIRGLAEIHRRRGELDEALTEYRAALSLAPNDPDLEHLVLDLTAATREPGTPTHAAGVSLEPAGGESSLQGESGMPDVVAEASVPPDIPATAALAADSSDLDELIAELSGIVPEKREYAPGAAASSGTPTLDLLQTVVPWAALAPMPVPAPDDGAEQRRSRTVAALEQWLAAIHVARSDAGA